MDTGTALIALLVVVGFAVLTGLLLRRSSGADTGGVGEKLVRLEEKMAALETKNTEMTQALRSGLGDTTRLVQSQLGESTKLVRDVTEQLTGLKETNRQVVGFADQLQQLQDILKNPKQRGVLGEYYLETVLRNVLPPGSYEMQYRFSDGEIVDAVVKVREGIVPVDSKFSLENYNRLAEARDDETRARYEKLFVNDLKQRITETAKYIRPAEGTTEFAFMFIPHEAIYYDLLSNQVGALHTEDTENLIQRAASKYKVIIVSPTSFLAYLQTVIQGLKALKIERTAVEIQKRVEQLGKHITNYNQFAEKVGTKLDETRKAYEAAAHELQKVDTDVIRIGKIELAEDAALPPPVRKR